MLSDAIAEMSELIEVKDLRDPSKIRYPLVPTLFAIMLAWMCGYNSAVKVEMFWYIKFGILKKLIPNFPDHKISHDTVNRILSLIIVDDLKGILSHFSQLVIENRGAEGLEIKRILALDGQTPKAAEYAPGKGFMEHSNDDKRLHQRLYYVTLFDSTNGLSLGMEEVYVKENENKACVRAIEMFDLAGTVVTADALNTQRSVAEAIIRQGGDYVLAVKDNHKSIRKAIRQALEDPLLVREFGDVYESETELGYGRIEQRTVVALPVSAIKNKRVFGEWKQDCNTVFMGITTSYNKKHEVERAPQVRLFVSSLSFDNTGIAALGYRALREHWGIENKLHWCLDMDFGQDHMQIKNRNYLRNCEVLSRLSLNVLRTLQPLPEFNRSTRKEVQSLTGIMRLLDGLLEQHIETVARLFANGEV